MPLSSSWLFSLFSLCCLFLVVRSDVGPSASPAPTAATSYQKVESLFNEMLRRWEILDARCDPDAVFALTYMYMTYGVRQFMGMNYFDDGDGMAEFTVQFASRYIAAYDNWAAGNMDGVSGPWKIALGWSASGKSNATENLLQGMNAHINYDLAIITYQMQYNNLQRKPDFDRINDLLEYVMQNVSLDLADRYDPSLGPSPLDAIILPLIILWRGNAWANALEYDLSLLSPLLQNLNELTATVAATVMQPLRFENTTAARQSFCHAHHSATKLPAFPAPTTPPSSVSTTVNTIATSTAKANTAGTSTSANTDGILTVGANSNNGGSGLGVNVGSGNGVAASVSLGSLSIGANIL